MNKLVEKDRKRLCGIKTLCGIKKLLVEKDRKKLYGIIKSDDVNKLKQLDGLISDKNGNIGYVNQRIKSGKSYEPLVQCIESNSEDCFNFISSIDGLELHKYYYLYNVLSNTNNMRFFDKILDQKNFQVEKCLRLELKNKNMNMKKIKKLITHNKYEKTMFNDFLKCRKLTFDLLQIFIDNNVDFDEDVFMKNALLNFNKKLIDFFMSRGFDINKTWFDNKTPLLTLVDKIYQPKLNKQNLNFLIKRGLNINKEYIIYNVPYTIIQYCINNHNFNAICILEKCGMEIKEEYLWDLSTLNTSLNYQPANKRIRSILDFFIKKFSFDILYQVKDGNVLFDSIGIDIKKLFMSHNSYKPYVLKIEERENKLCPQIKLPNVG
jgi:hypothetical protein